MLREIFSFVFLALILQQFDFIIDYLTPGFVNPELREETYQKRVLMVVFISTKTS